MTDMRITRHGSTLCLLALLKLGDQRLSSYGKAYFTVLQKGWGWPVKGRNGGGGIFGGKHRLLLHPLKGHAQVANPRRAWLLGCSYVR
jgi:hypothetical protein